MEDKGNVKKKIKDVPDAGREISAAGAGYVKSYFLEIKRKLYDKIVVVDQMDF